MTVSLLFFACAKPTPLQSATLLLHQRGFDGVELRPNDGSTRTAPDALTGHARPGVAASYTWTGRHEDQTCHGVVEVDQVRRRRPRGRTMTTCSLPHPNGIYSALEHCEGRIRAVWTLTAHEGRFRLDTEGLEPSVHIAGFFRDGAMQIDWSSKGTDDVKSEAGLPIQREGRRQWRVEPGAFPTACGESLLFDGVVVPL